MTGFDRIVSLKKIFWVKRGRTNVDVEARVRVLGLKNCRSAASLSYFQRATFICKNIITAVIIWTDQNSSYKCIILPFLVLKVISWKPGREYSTILQYKKHFRRILCSRYVIYKPAYKLEKSGRESSNFSIEVRHERENERFRWNQIQYIRGPGGLTNQVHSQCF